MLQFILSLLIKLSSKSMSQLKTYNDTSETRDRKGGGPLKIIFHGGPNHLLLWGRISVMSRKIFRISTITHALKEFPLAFRFPWRYYTLYWFQQIVHTLSLSWKNVLSSLNRHYWINCLLCFDIKSFLVLLWTRINNYDK